MKQSDRLEYLFNEVESVILSRQHPVTGLLPASTSVNTHGDYTDAWVRDNVYSILCVWALGLAFRRNNGDQAKTDQLEQATMKLMRGLLQSMMRQSPKVERFKYTLNSVDALHAKYDTATGLEVVADHEWGHLQIDATSLYLLILAQMSASGLRIIRTLSEVDFVQNLVYYINSAYRVPDFGIWERGNKINNGKTEINASSLGMAKAALQALDGFNLFGRRATPQAVIHSVPDAVSLARGTLRSLLPRESLSKEVDSALLSIIGFPAFAVGDQVLVEKTRKEILSKLAGRYGCKRFLLDGHQTVVEESSRIYYERTELANFEHIESEWPLFYTYFYLHALFDDDRSLAQLYRERLEGLMVEVHGHSMLPELYYLPEENITAEKQQPHSQERIPNNNVPLVWAQSLYLTGLMLDEDLLRPQDLDALKLRTRSTYLNNTQMALVILAENEEVKKRLAENSVVAETISDIAPLQVISAPHLVEAYALVGANDALGLSGRPRRRLQSLTTSQTYTINHQIFLCLSWLQSDRTDYRSMDAQLLSEYLNREIHHILNNWINSEVAVFTLMIDRYLCEASNINVLFNTLRQLQLHAEYEHVGYASAALAYRASRVNELIIPNLCITSIVEEPRESELIHEEDLLEGVRTLLESWQNLNNERDFYYTLSDFIKDRQLEQSISETSKSLTVYNLLKYFYEQAAKNQCWLVTRCCFSFLGFIHKDLADGLTQLVARDFSIVIDQHQRHIIDRPMENDDIADLINDVTSDPLERVLLQEVLAVIGTLIRTEPKMLYGLRTIQLHNLIRLCESQRKESSGLYALSPFELFKQIRAILASQSEEFYKELNFSQFHKDFNSGSAVAAHAVYTDWFEWRVARGLITRFDDEFLQSLWQSLIQARIIVFGDMDCVDTILDCDLARRSTTAGEESFAQLIDGFVQQLHPAYYRAAVVEVLYGYVTYCLSHPEAVFNEPILLGQLLEQAAGLFAAQQKNTELDKASHLQQFLQEPPYVLQEYLFKAIEQQINF